MYTYTEALSKKEEDQSLNSLNTNQKEVDYIPHIGASLHNIGILHLLNDDFEGALTFFQKASIMLKGNGGMEYVVSTGQKMKS